MAAAGAGGAETKYIENNFSPQVYKGSGAGRSIPSGVDLSTDGGLVITKNRDSASSWMWGSTAPSLGVGKWINTDSIGQRQTDAQSYTAFNDDGYSIGTTSGINGLNNDIVSYSFRKAPGFLDIVEFVGNGASSRNIPHNLGSVPGWMVIMCTTKSENKTSWHRGFQPNYSIYMDSSNGAGNIGAYPQPPTDTQFTIGSYPNISGETYVAWIFAGGESTAATARSVDFDGSGDDLRWASNTDFVMGTGDFTWEGWIKPDNWNNTYMTVFCVGSGSNTGGLWIGKNQSNFVVRAFSVADYIQTTDFPPLGQWTHVAVSRSGTTLKLFYNGLEQKSVTNSYNFSGGDDIWISNDGYNNRFVGGISNVRLVKGTAVYTSTFTSPTVPLTNITNTKLLCCNDSSVTGSTVTPGTITANGDPTASTDSPFDDPEGYKFGGGEDQNIIKCGSYPGNGSTDGPEIYLGWEPSFIILKCFSHNGESWEMYDEMRRMANSSSGTAFLKPNSNSNEATATIIEVNPTGFKLKDSSGTRNNSGKSYMYVAIRRPDPLVAKPVKVGTDVLRMTPGTAGAPLFQSANHKVDFSLQKSSYQSGTADWTAVSRLTQLNRLETNTNTSDVPNSYQVGDYQDGWSSYTGGDGSRFAWLFKRYAGLDVVTWIGTNTSRVRRHNLGRIPEMIWFKNRTTSRNWRVYHKGLNGGTNPEDYAIQLNSQSPEASNTNYMTSTAPTSTTFVAGNDDDTNGFGDAYVAYLFASVNGISKVGSYTGNGTNGHEIPTGFSPRFVIIRRRDGSQDNWVVLDTTRGWAAGNDNYISLNLDTAQTSGDMGAPTATGFTLSSDGWVNHNTGKYIYYAHA